MPDVVDSATRSRMMAGIRGKNTKPELVFPKYKAVIQVQGCFWHGHDCHLFKWPSTRQEFWKKKISGNKERDARNLKALGELGWRTLTVWEIKKNQKISQEGSEYDTGFTGKKLYRSSSKTFERC